MKILRRLFILFFVCISFVLLPAHVFAKTTTQNLSTQAEKLISKYHKSPERINGLQGVLKDYKHSTADLHRVEKKQKLAKKKLEKIRLKHATKGEDIDRENNKINKILEQFKKKEAERMETESRISLTKKEIRTVETKLTSREDVFKERLKNSRNENPYLNYISVLFKSKSFSDMIMQYQMVKKISAEDNRVIEEYMDTQEELKDRKAQLQKETTHLTRIMQSLKKLKSNSEKVLSHLTSEQKTVLQQMKQQQHVVEKIHTTYVDQNEVQQDLKETLEEEIQFTKDFETYHFTKAEGIDSHVQRLLNELIRRCEDVGIHIQLTDGYRSIDEQNRLFAQGRSTGGKVVTNARGGESYHNYGLAVDVAFVKGDKVTWEQYDMNHNGKDDWQEIGAIGEKIGFEWGGSWTGLVDRPHFQYTYGKSLTTLYKEATGKSSSAIHNKQEKDRTKQSAS